MDPFDVLRGHRFRGHHKLDIGLGLPNLGAKVQLDVLPVVIVRLRWRIGQAGALAKLSDLLIMRLLLL